MSFSFCFFLKPLKLTVFLTLYMYKDFRDNVLTLKDPIYIIPVNKKLQHYEEQL